MEGVTSEMFLMDWMMSLFTKVLVLLGVPLFLYVFLHMLSYTYDALAAHPFIVAPFSPISVTHVICFT